ncbi:MAG: class I SAM-dependent methyltransferase [bacterium]|nr:class I SAM-dependent methyltransferase [bacterium]
MRHRRDLIAYRIDQLAERQPGKPRVLSVACGHFREGRMSVAVQTGHLEEVVALDADPESLTEVAASSPAVVTPCEMSVRGLLSKNTDLGSFDFIYSAGLYDYLEDRLATALTARLFAMLRPGGKLLFCNFLPDTPDIGYMETFMGWELIYRNLGEIVKLTADCDPSAMAATHRYQDGFGSVGYVEVVKAAE